ncbi:MAG: EAL domain-containing protein, partial [Gammaproteobacteria bacterium]|nr:EAL domain-containing protein [Gammaproteobacteria bacterium]
EDDALLLLRHLQRGGLRTYFERVDDAFHLRGALARQQWDIVITDHNMPGFSSVEALKVVRELEPDLPVIIVSGTIEEAIAVQAMNAGAHDYVMKDNLARLLPAVERELRDAQVRKARRQAEQHLHYVSHHDTLTDLANRREFERRLELALQSCRERGVEHMLIYLDLDQFKVVNDTCGHTAGDELLKQLTGVLSRHIRNSDTLARLGGDEFGILLDSCDATHAVHLAEKLRKAVEQHRFVWSERTFVLSISVGLVPVTAESASTAELLSQADIACYAAKDRGRNTLQLFESGNQDLHRRRTEMEWASRIREALEQELFFLCQQPMQPLNAECTAGPCAEFLIRLHGEDGEVVPPGAFLPAAERFNLMPLIDRWVIRRAFRYLSETGLGQEDSGTYFINLSGASLSDKSLFKDIRTYQDYWKVKPERICFEITETAAIGNLSDAVEFIREIRDEGFRFALDDFGSGLSSFAYLKTIPVDFLKIDGSFVLNLLANPIDQGIVEACNRIGHAAGLTTIAEFVENDAVRERLAEMGIDIAQGFGIARPTPLP